MVIVDADVRVLAALQVTISGEPDLVVAAVVTDAAEAVQAAVKWAPCVALVDVPVGETGPELRSVVMLSRVAGCRVVAMSARSAARAATSDAGAVGFVVKGADVDAILSIIRGRGSSAV